MSKTDIEWATHVWNPVTGCSRVSPGCAHCYALELAPRLRAMGSAKYHRARDGGKRSGPAFGVTLHPDELRAPLRWRKPRMVFVNSMSDLFHEEVPDEYILAVWAVMEAAPQHTFQILTKRPERMRELLGVERPATPPAVPYERRPLADWYGYFADTEGEIWSARRGGMRRMSPDVGAQGHRRVMLYDGHGQGHRRLVHRLVLATFDRPPLDGEQACHRDGDPSNNRIENLYWGTQGENWADRNRHGNGRSHSKLTARDVAEIRIAALRGESACSLSRRFGVSDTQVRNITTGRQWGFKVLPSVWLGVSIENRRFVGRADVLRETPAAVRFISAEPLLGPLIGTPVETGSGYVCEKADGSPRACSRPAAWHWPPDRLLCAMHGRPLDLEGIDWLIAGGESGPGHRPIREEWVRDLRDACGHAGTAFFLKQWGGARPGGAAELDGREYREMPAVTAHG